MITLLTLCIMTFRLLTSLACAATLVLSVAGAAHAQTGDTQAPDLQALQRTLAQRIPQLSSIDEIRPTPMPGLFEVRIDTGIFYASANGDFLIQGELYDTQAKRNLTEERIKALTAIPFDKLPFKDSFTIVRGDGSRKIAVFEDPNCGYCKRFERDMGNLDNVTIHIFLYPILGADSVEKSRNIWCSQDPTATWNAWMLQDQTPAAQSACENVAAIERNVTFGRQLKITGTPTVLFEDGTRVPGAIPAADVEKKLQEIAQAK